MTSFSFLLFALFAHVLLLTERLFCYQYQAMKCLFLSPLKIRLSYLPYNQFSNLNRYQR